MKPDECQAQGNDNLSSSWLHLKMKTDDPTHTEAFVIFITDKMLSRVEMLFYRLFRYAFNANWELCSSKLM